MMTASVRTTTSPAATHLIKTRQIRTPALAPLSPITNGVPRQAGLKKRSNSNSPRLASSQNDTSSSSSNKQNGSSPSSEKRQRHHHHHHHHSSRRKREDLRKKVLSQKKRASRGNSNDKALPREKDFAAYPIAADQIVQQSEQSRLQSHTSRSSSNDNVRKPSGGVSASPSRKRKPPSPYFKGRSEAERLEKLVDFLVQKCTQLQGTLALLTEEKTRKDATLQEMEDKNGVFAERLKGLSARNERLMQANNNLHTMLESAVEEAEAAARALQEQKELNNRLEALQQQQEREPKQISHRCKHCKRDAFEEDKSDEAIPAEQPLNIHVQDLEEHSEAKAEKEAEDFTSLSLVADTTLGTIEEEDEEDEERWLSDETASSAVGGTNLSGNCSIGAGLEQSSSNQCECDLFGWEGPGHSPACDCWVVGS